MTEFASIDHYEHTLRQLEVNLVLKTKKEKWLEISPYTFLLITNMRSQNVLHSLEK